MMIFRGATLNRYLLRPDKTTIVPRFYSKECVRGSAAVKFIYSEKATKFFEISTNYLTGS